jgi:hypothetical protein
LSAHGAEGQLADEHRIARLRLAAQEALVLLETEWVLRSRYGLSKGEILGTFSGLLDSVVVQ